MILQLPFTVHAVCVGLVKMSDLQIKQSVMQAREMKGPKGRGLGKWIRGEWMKEWNGDKQELIPFSPSSSSLSLPSLIWTSTAQPPKPFLTLPFLSSLLTFPFPPLLTEVKWPQSLQEHHRGDELTLLVHPFNLSHTHILFVYVYFCLALHQSPPVQQTPISK